MCANAIVQCSSTKNAKATTPRLKCHNFQSLGNKFDGMDVRSKTLVTKAHKDFCKRRLRARGQDQAPQWFVRLPEELRHICCGIPGDPGKTVQATDLARECCDAGRAGKAFAWERTGSVERDGDESAC